MRILWFSNTAASGEEFLKINAFGGGWLSSLDKAIKDHVELHVAFYYVKYSEDFEYLGIKYYPICKKNWKFNIIKNSVLPKFIDKEDLNIYMSIIDKVKPDLIHIHGTENPFGCIIDHTNIPVVISIQGNMTVYSHKYFSGIESRFLGVRKYNFNNFRDFLFTKSFKQEYSKYIKMQIREKLNLKKSKYIIGRTDWDRRITRILAPNSLYFHGDELLRDPFYSNIWEYPLNDKLILHTTNGNTFYKGFETLCLALNELDNLNINVEWRVAGISKNDTIVEVVKKKLKSKYPSKGLKLLGGLNENDLVKRLLEAHIYIMPSHIENSPNNLCEAMILGMPCIATFAGGTGSLLKDSEDGILIQDGDPWVMAGAILELYNNRVNAIQYGKNARIRALKRHDKKTVVNQLLEIYKNIVKINNK